MSAGFACHLVQIVGVLCLICSLFLPSSGLCARCLCFFWREALLCASGFDFVWQAFQWPSMGSHCRLGSRWFASVDVCVCVCEVWKVSIFDVDCHVCNVCSSASEFQLPPGPDVEDCMAGDVLVCVIQVSSTGNH